jgi:hypothetical protein
MPTYPIQIKRSGTAASAPSSLAHGELALNYADKVLYFKDASNVIQSFTFQSYALASHSHAASDITSGTLDAARLPLATTGAAGAVIVGTGLGVSSGTVSVTYGTSSTSACRGDDSRLSDTRTPTDGSVTTAKIANDAVTYAKIQNVSATDRLLGRSSAGAGDVEEITCTSFGRSLIDDANAEAARTTLSVQPTASPAFTGTATVENLTLSGSARRIVADFSNADFASRAMFQSSASNASTVVAGVPSGTGSTCVFRAFGASDVTNANFMTIGMFSGTDASIRAEYRGTASAIPLTFHTGGTTQLTISSTGTATFAGQIVGQAGAAITGAATFENSGNVVPLTVTNAGTANSFVVNDASGDSDPFVIDAAGRIAIGATAAFSDSHKFAILGGLPSSAGVTAGFVLRVLVPSSSTNNFISCLSNIGTEAASYTVNSLEHYAAAQQSLGAGSAIGSQYGFVARDSLTGATNNFGFWSNIASGTGRWNFYANGTAPNYFGGQVTVASPVVLTGTVAGNVRQLRMQTSGSTRWEVGPGFDAESGSNVGSTLWITRWSDAGAFLGTPIAIDRATGRATFENTVVVPAGSVSSCSVAPFSDLNTGLYFPAANVAAVVTDGVERVRVDASGNVGIGATPSTQLHVGSLGVFRLQTGSVTMDCTPTAGALDGFVWNTNPASYYQWNTGGTQRLLIGSDGKITCKGLYDNTVGATNRDVFVDSGGVVGYVSSIRESKTDIVTLDDVSWLSALAPVSYRYRKRNADGTYSDEADGVTDYGLIAEDVEAVRPELCFYDMVDGDPQLRGVTYSKLITPMLKYIQQLEARIAALEERING